MKIKTKIPVKYNNGLLNVETGLLFGKIQNVIIYSDFNNVEIVYQYEDENGNVIHQNVFVIKDDEIDNLSLNIFNLLPENYNELPERERMKMKYYSGFAIKMAETFEINIEDLEIIL